MSILSELRRRNVFRVAAGYGVISWLLVQVSATVLPLFGAPDWIARSLVIVLAIGFIPVVILAWGFELTPEGVKTQQEADVAGLSSRLRGRRVNLALIGVLFCAAALFWVGRQSGQRGPQTDAPIADEASIAVLPFVNMSADKDNEYFSDGLSETLLDMLAQVPALKVPARTSSFAFKGKSEDVRGIGVALGVANLLEGSVQKAGTQMRITAQLVRTSDGAHIWSKHFDRKLDDVFKIQDEIATEVVSALKLTLVRSDAARLTQKRTDNVVAYQEYLKGIALMPDRKVGNLRAAAAYFEHAIELDPAFARAYAGAAEAYGLLGEYGTVSDEERARSRRHAERAIELAPDLGEAHAALGLVIGYAHDWEGSKREYRRAIELSPSYASAFQWLSERLREEPGHTEEAVSLAERAVALDPLSPVLQNSLADAQDAAAQRAQAYATLKKLAAQHPGYPAVYGALAQHAASEGDLAGALRAMNRHDAADPEAIGYSLQRCQILMSFSAIDAARNCAEAFAERAPDNVEVLGLQAQLAAFSGDLEGALALLERCAPGYSISRAWTLLTLGRADEAVAILRGIPGYMADPPLPIGPRSQVTALVVGSALLRTDAHEQGRKLIELAIQATETRPSGALPEWPWGEVIGRDLLGQRDLALAALRRVVDAGGFVDLVILDKDHAFASLRADPRYEAIVAPARAKAAEQVQLAKEARLL
jgi:TolB-like protein/tetratricopeptide (TPR) repeat protein